jgi:hypothetical protein
MPMKPGRIVVSFEYSRIVGPRSIHGGLTLRFFDATSFEFLSSAAWPAEDLTAVVKETVRSVLAERDSLESTGCELVSVRWDSVNSCQSGFEAAARMAANAAFEL